MYKSLFCQLPSCNLFTQHVIYLYGETPLVNCGPQSFSFTLIQSSTANTYSVYFLQALFSLFYCKHLFPHDMFNPLFSANRWDWQPHWTLGQSILIVLCAGSTLLLTPIVRPAKSQPATPSEVTRFSYWSIKPWFLTEGKLAATLIIPSSWGYPTRSNHSPSSTVVTFQGYEINGNKFYMIAQNKKEQQHKQWCPLWCNKHQWVKGHILWLHRGDIGTWLWT